MRTDLRPLADHGDVGVAELPAALAQQFVAVADEAAVVGALPARVRRWEVAADVAQRQRAEHRVAQRMPPPLPVPLRAPAAFLRPAHAPTPDASPSPASAD